MDREVIHVRLRVARVEDHFRFNHKALGNVQRIVDANRCGLGRGARGCARGLLLASRNGEEAVAEAPPTDDPWIETARCSTCNECTALNDRMFAYNENQQAYVKDPSAGTYRQLVEAAESCQVAIIHPGKPVNLSEAGLDELLKRAEAFA